MEERYFKILQCALEGIELTEEETRLLKWIAEWDGSIVRRFVQIIKKCCESDK